MNRHKEEIIKHYIDLVGMVTVDKNPSPASTKNGLMHLGYYLCLLDDINELESEDIENFYQTVKWCEEVPGVYDRYPAYDYDGVHVPRNNDANAHDDARGVVSGSVVSQLKFQKDVLSYGVKHLFMYNNITPGKFIEGWNPLKWNWWALRFRFVDDTLWYFMVNKYLLFLSPFLMIKLLINQKLSKPGYSHILNYMLVKSMSKVSKFWKRFRVFYMKDSKLIESSRDYFKASHPIVELAIDAHVEIFKDK